MKKTEQVQIIKRKLWASQYKVRDMTELYQVPPFDLLVEGKYKVIVGGERKKGMVCATVDDKGVITYRLKNKGENLKTTSHFEMFGKPQAR